jgi:hypothetical protein
MRNKVNYTLKKRSNTFKLAIMQVEDFQIDGDKITEEQLNALYIYLSMTFDNMKDEEKTMWYQIMQKIDKEFYEQD